MKYTIPFLMVILTMSFFACKKKKDDTSPAPEIQRLAASFTGMKTWRTSYTYIIHAWPTDRDTTVFGTESFAVSYVKGDTISILDSKLWFDSSEGDSSSRFVLRYKGYEPRSGHPFNSSASFVHTPSGDTIYYSYNISGFGSASGGSYVTP